MLVRLATLLTVCLLTLAPLSSAMANAKQATRLLKIIEGKDFRSYFDVSYEIQREVEKIKVSKPKVLWPELIKKYYDDNYGKFSKPATGEFNWGTFMEASMGSGQALDSFRDLANLLSLKHKRKILESRPQAWTDMFNFSERQGTIVYVSISYSSANNSPFVKDKPLKETIVQLLFDNATGYFVSSSRVEEGDVFWDARIGLICIVASDNGRGGIAWGKKGNECDKAIMFCQEKGTNCKVKYRETYSLEESNYIRVECSRGLNKNFTGLGDAPFTEALAFAKKNSPGCIMSLATK